MRTSKWLGSRLGSQPVGLPLRKVIIAWNDQSRRSSPPMVAYRSGVQCNDADEGCSRELHNADAPPFPRRNFLITVVDGVIELIESLGVVAILAPITRLRQEAVLALCCSDGD